MIIFFGTRSSRGATINTMQKCPSCSMDHSIIVVPYHRYFHVFWIPMFPIGTEYGLGCVNCGSSFSANQLPLDHETKHQIKKPKWLFAGLVLFAVLIGFTMITASFSTAKDKRHMTEIIQNPQVGDEYEVRLSSKEYSLMKVASIAPDSIYFYLNEYSTNKYKGLDRLRREHGGDYDNEYVEAYSKSELLSDIGGRIRKINR